MLPEIGAQSQIKSEPLPPSHVDTEPQCPGPASGQGETVAGHAGDEDTQSQTHTITNTPLFPFVQF